MIETVMIIKRWDFDGYAIELDDTGDLQIGHTKISGVSNFGAGNFESCQLWSGKSMYKFRGIGELYMMDEVQL